MAAFSAFSSIIYWIELICLWLVMSLILTLYLGLRGHYCDLARPRPAISKPGQSQKVVVETHAIVFLSLYPNIITCGGKYNHRKHMLLTTKGHGRCTFPLQSYRRK